MSYTLKTASYGQLNLYGAVFIIKQDNIHARKVSVLWIISHH